MKIRHFKYLLAYLIPFSAYLALEFQSFWSYGTVILAFVIIPIFEIAVKPNPRNYFPEEERKLSTNRFFDFLLYINIPILYFLIFKTLIVLTTGVPLGILIGLILNMGIVLATAGINVGHEIGHREGLLNKICATLLLAPSFYGHFTIEHNYGHHKWIGTPKDPVTAKLNQHVYSFIISAVAGVYKNAWMISFRMMEKAGKKKFHFSNELIWISLFQLLLFAGFYVYGGPIILLSTIAMAVISFSLLEIIDYVEHYGLKRKMLPSGKYERVSAKHSWNSDHELGRIMLYELTRHADHHANERRKFQVLRHFEKSPQLAYGYPASILLSLVPPIWFKEMNKRAKLLNN